jgi:two-component system, cell cycle sensor histidine kinase and response regulator CckA
MSSAPASTPPPIRVLHLEDTEADHVLVREMLAAEGLACEIELARNRTEFEAAVQRGRFDLIISDFSLPSYDGTKALALAEQWQKDVPFIFFSGTIGEETAVESLKTGATDYVVKQRPRRLVAAVRRALQEAQDRTRREQAEKKIREQAALLDKAQDAIVVCNLEDRVTFWNPSATRIYGWSAAEALGRRLTELLADPMTPAFAEARRNLLDHGEWSGELHEQAKGGRPVVVRTSWTLVRDDAGQPQSKLIISTDVTEQKALEEKFLRTQRLESLGVLVGGIAHDLNNALTPVLMGAGLLETVPLPPGMNDVVGTMKTSALRGSQMVQQILTFARGSGTQRTVIHVHQLLREMGKIITDTFPKAIQCRVQAGVDSWPVSGMAVQLHQVLMNLCINARDAMPKGGILVLATENVVLDEARAATIPGGKAGRFLCLQVRDTGTGIPEHQLPQIFQPFFTTKAPGHGTGLGLSTTQMIVQNHGGFITVESALGRGTELKVYLPALESAAQDVSTAPTAPLPVGKGELILVVDDETAVLALAQSSLETYGYRVLTAASGPAAILTFTREADRIQMVIMDKSMPFMNGAATINALRKIKPHVKVLEASGHDLHQLSETDLQIKADAHLEKPFTVGQLVTAVHTVLNPA